MKKNDFKNRLLFVVMCLCLFVSCSDDGSSNSNPTTSQVNVTCVENAQTVLNEITYVCQNDSLVPIVIDEPNTITGLPQSSNSEHINNQNFCMNNGEWKYDGMGNKIICLENTWTYLDYLQSSSSMLSSSSSKNIHISYGMLKDDRDGQVYKTVTIETQTWMAQNLNYFDSVSTPFIYFKGAETGCYFNSLDSCSKYGRLYPWAWAMNLAVGNSVDYSYNATTDIITLPHQGICPVGWHIPTNEEWKKLGSFLGEYNERYHWFEYIGKGLKYTGTWYKVDMSGDTLFVESGTNEFGFAALPAGFNNSQGWYRIGENTHFWSATENIPTQNDITNRVTQASSWSLDETDSFVLNERDQKMYWYSVRCLKD